LTNVINGLPELLLIGFAQLVLGEETPNVLPAPVIFGAHLREIPILGSTFEERREVFDANGVSASVGSSGLLVLGDPLASSGFLAIVHE